MMMLAIAADMGCGQLQRMHSMATAQKKGTESMSQFHPERGWALTPNSVHRRPVGKSDVIYTIDADGYRHIPKRGEANQRVFFFGDSFTFGQFVDDGAVFSALIASDFVGPDVHLFNAGVSGYGLIQAVQRFLEIADGLTPSDLVVFTPITADLRRSLNDFDHVGHMMLRNPELTIFPSYQDGEIRVVPIDTIWMRLRAMLYTAPLTGRTFVQLNRSRAEAIDIAQARELIDMVRTRTEERGARFALFFLPKASELQKGYYKIDISSFDYFDIRSFFPTDEVSLAALRFPDDGHWSCFAHAHGAKAIATTLAREGLLTITKQGFEPSGNCGCSTWPRVSRDRRCSAVEPSG
jgi:hypothetical protein